MTTYVYHKSDFVKGAPKVLPPPLIAGALFFSGGTTLTDEIVTFLTGEGIDTDNLGNIWMVLVWDARQGDAEIARAAFVWTGTDVELLAISVDASHPALPIRQFLLQTGSGLFGGRPVVERAAQGQPSDGNEGEDVVSDAATRNTTEEG